MSTPLTRAQIERAITGLLNDVAIKGQIGLMTTIVLLSAQDAALREQLATAWQAVWEEAAKKCHELLEMTKNDKETWGNPDLIEMLHGRCQAHANFESYCREQARKEQP